MCSHGVYSDEFDTIGWWFQTLSDCSSLESSHFNQVENRHVKLLIRNRKLWQYPLSAYSTLSERNPGLVLDLVTLEAQFCGISREADWISRKENLFNRVTSRQSNHGALKSPPLMISIAVFDEHRIIEKTSIDFHHVLSALKLQPIKFQYLMVTSK